MISSPTNLYNLMTSIIPLRIIIWIRSSNREVVGATIVASQCVASAPFLRSGSLEVHLFPTLCLPYNHMPASATNTLSKSHMVENLLVLVNVMINVYGLTIGLLIGSESFHRSRVI